ncbi:MAG: 1-deoxy-D-xylulose-5-phosphate synthase, partial [Proteobacteria bacterium]
RNILYTAQLGLDHPIAIRYPRGRGVVVDWKQPYAKIAVGKARQLRKGERVAVLSTGFIGNNVADALNNVTNADFSHYDFGFIKPLDAEMLERILRSYERIITVEDGTVKGGFGSAVAEFAMEINVRTDIRILGIPDEFIQHGSILELQRFSDLDVKSLEIIFSNY